ncbi:serine-type peptidase-like protein [Pleomassaria siparia CBS 279.74]|uniref:Serine-type peptidase-like protein n=1 Tax=Pleomassaria siparia CBS 279.74 TaxID=1314801 RepID=A0A6G1KD94_9PLEO|nr:serine-type peptidase-like protein [Pleomassaria siparia CBS 279.74]
MRFSQSSVASVAIGLLALATGASAVLGQHMSAMRIGPIDDDTDLDGVAGFNGWGTFDQLLDHSNPNLGTFEQRYWYGTQYWNGTGSPIYLTTPGEQDATGFNVTYTTEKRLTGLMAKTTGGAVIILEHRYWGKSSPFDVLSEKNLQYLTLDNSLKDLIYFAKNFDPPFDKTGGSHPEKAPWIFTGGSYSGALAGWLESVEPGTYWAYYGTSAVLEAVRDMWTMFVPVIEATPKNCSSDQQAVIAHIDNTFTNGTAAEKSKLKKMFLLEDVEDADFGAALETGPWLWQGTQFYTESVQGYNEYYRFCDYIENVFPVTNSTVVPGSEGVGLEKALAGYAKWWTESIFPGFCESYGYAEFNGTYNTECLKALNPKNPLYTDLTVANYGQFRQWQWMLCNEPFGWWQTGAPAGQPSIVSRLVTAEYYEKTCGFYFPSLQLQGKSVAKVNQYTGGWSNNQTTRLMQTNGELDTWKEVTVISDFRPGGPLRSTPEMPVRIVKGGVHCSDLYGNNWAVNEGVKAIADAEVAQMAGWVEDFYKKK